MKRKTTIGVVLALMAATALWHAPRQVRFEIVREEAVNLVREGNIERMSEEAYLTGVLACEMPARYDIQALMAQAVCARTRLWWQRENGGCGAGDICAQSAHCQGYLSETERAEKWGEQAENYEEKLRSAVRATHGEIMTYGGAPILTLYHAQSGGATEDVEHVFAQSLPYLRSVISPEEQDVREVLIARKSVIERVNAAFAQAQLSEDLPLEEQLEIESRYDSGRVQSVRVGKTRVSGRDFRAALSLRSAMFDFSFQADALLITQVGYGHGVGMSQAGAEEMALTGSDYREILEHYYTGIQIFNTEDS